MGQAASALDVFGRCMYHTTVGAWIFLPKSKFEPERDVPDLTGKVVIVTGGNNGIGKETCKVLLRKNAKVYLAARNESRAKAAISELLQETKREAIWLKLDLSSFQSIEEASAEFHSKEKELHVLFNNAGVVTPPQDLTTDGYDMTFGTNVLGPYYLTELLLPALYRASTPGNKPRVVNLSSQLGIIGASPFGSGLNFATFKDSPARRKMSSAVSYNQSKLGNVVYAQELARRRGDKITSVSVHPGPTRSDLPRTSINLDNPVFWFFYSLITFPVPMGAITPLYAGTSTEVEQLNGKYFMPWAREGTPRSNDPVLGRELWTWLEEQVEGREYFNEMRAQMASLR